VADELSADDPDAATGEGLSVNPSGSVICTPFISAVLISFSPEYRPRPDFRRSAAGLVGLGCFRFDFHGRI